MNEKNNLNERCCSMNGYQVCFPTTQEVNSVNKSNPYYNFNEKKSFWTYTIQIDTNQSDLSHWNLAMCGPFIQKIRDQIDDQEIDVNILDFFQVEIKKEGEEFTEITNLEELPGGDPSIQPINLHNIPVLKIENPQSADGQTYIYRIIIKDEEYFNLAAEPGMVPIKTGGPPDVGFYIFNSYQEYMFPEIPFTCTGENTILGPAIDCNQVDPPTRGIEL